MIIAVDTETTGLNVWLGNRPFAIGLGYSDDKTSYCDTFVEPETRLPNWPKDINDWWNIVTNDYNEKVFANAKFDIHMLRSIGIEVKGKIHDVLLAAKIVNNLEPSTKLKALAKKYLGFPDDDQKRLQQLTLKARDYGRKHNWKLGEDVAEDYWMVKQVLDDNTCEEYCRKDCQRTIQLWEYYEKALQEFNVYHIYEREMGLLEEVILLEARGINFNKQKCLEKVSKLTFDIMDLEKKINPNINLNSPQQLQKYLMEDLGIPLKEETDGSTPIDRKYKTGIPILKQFRKHHEKIEMMLMRSGWDTGKGYLFSYLKNVDHNNLIHTSINQFVARTFRLSSSDPNLQNASNPFTSGGEYVVDCREVFGPRPNYIWYVIDYAQLELRIFVARCGYGDLLQAFRDGIDPHNVTRLKVPYLASLEPGIGRKLAKNTNFTLINVGGPGVLNEKYSIPIDEAIEIHKGFHYAYPETRIRWKEIEGQAKLNGGYIWNAFNRKLWLDPDKIYQASSYDIQSDAADLIKIAMIRLGKFFREKKLDCHLLLQVHDELIIECHEQHWDDKVLMDEIKNIMEDHFGVFCIDTPVEFKRTKTHWNDKELVKL